MKAAAHRGGLTVSTEAADSRDEQSRHDAQCDGGGRAFQQTTRHNGKSRGDYRQTSQDSDNDSGNVAKGRGHLSYLSCVRPAERDSMMGNLMPCFWLVGSIPDSTPACGTLLQWSALASRHARTAGIRASVSVGPDRIRPPQPCPCRKLGKGGVHLAGSCAPYNPSCVAGGSVPLSSRRYWPVLVRRWQKSRLGNRRLKPIYLEMPRE
jgi:hypothetical protein